MSDETVKQDAEALADVKKRRGRPRKQKSMENETKESTVETQDMEASAGTQEKKVFKISRTPKIKIKKKDTIPLQGQEEGVDEGPAPEVEGFVHPLEDTREEQMELPLAPESSGITMNSTLSEVLEDEKASLVFKPLVDAFITPFLGKSDGMSRMQVAMASDMPLRAAAVLTGAISLDEIREKLEELT